MDISNKDNTDILYTFLLALAHYTYAAVAIALVIFYIYQYVIEQKICICGIVGVNRVL